MTAAGIPTIFRLTRSRKARRDRAMARVCSGRFAVHPCSVAAGMALVALAVSAVAVVLAVAM